jgi:hypothetical protein
MVLAGVFCAGCASYATPGGPALLASLAADPVSNASFAPPVPSFPVHVNLVRVQAANYASLTAERVAGGSFSVVTPAERAGRPLKAVSQWPLVADAAQLRPALLPERLATLDDLRLAAAKNLADVLVVYTVDTLFEVDGRNLAPLAEVSLGKPPGERAGITSTASAVLIDVRSGYRYATVNADARLDDLDGAWLTSATLDKKRLETEQQALDALWVEAGKIWRGVTPAGVPDALDGSGA